jgi:alpha-glucuronidase
MHLLEEQNDLPEPLKGCLFILDECIDGALEKYIKTPNYVHLLRTNWRGKSNGILLNSCEEKEIKYLITCDKKMFTQQAPHIYTRKMSVILLHTKYNNYLSLKESFSLLMEKFEELEQKLEKGFFYIMKDKVLVKASNIKQYHDNRVGYIPVEIHNFT